MSINCNSRRSQSWRVLYPCCIYLFYFLVQHNDGFFIKLKYVGDLCVQWLYLLVFMYQHNGMSNVKKERMLERMFGSTREMWRKVHLWDFFLWPDCNQVFMCSGFTFQCKQTAVA